jgi:hypothetical protein
VAARGTQLPCQASDLECGMATDPDRQSDGRQSQPVRVLNRLPGGIHAVFQLAWFAGVAIPIATRVEELLHRPSASAAVAVIEVSAVWALVAALAWALRVGTLTSCGKWGGRTRQRVQENGRRREAGR